MQSESHMTYLGYGSLINDATRPPESRAFPGRLSGYQRGWRVRSQGLVQNRCALTVWPAPDAAMDAVLLVEPMENLPAVNKRERNYDRLIMQAGAFEHMTGQGAPNPADPALAAGPAPDLANAAIYQARAERFGWGDSEHPILQSYLDTVMLGVMNHFGAVGLARFIAETDGWEAPILRDRMEPFYPRAARLDGAVRELIDASLAKAGVSYIDLKAPWPPRGYR